MKKNEITTIEDLRDYLAEYCAQNPEDDCIDIVQDVCEQNGWTYTDDINGYDDSDFCTDGEHLLSLTADGWKVFEDEFLKENTGKYIVFRDNNVEEVELGAFDTLESAKNFANKETDGYEHCGVGPEDASKPTTFRLEVTDKDTLAEVYTTDYYYAD